MGYNNGVGREAPTFTITADDGSEIDLKQYRGDWYPVLRLRPDAGAEGIERLLASSSSSRRHAVGPARSGARRSATRLPRTVVALAGRIDGLAFPLLPDDGRVAASYGALKKSGEVRPMTIIVDRPARSCGRPTAPTPLKPATLIAAFRQVVR